MNAKELAAHMDVELALDAVHSALEVYGTHPDIGPALRDAEERLEDALWWLGK